MCNLCNGTHILHDIDGSMLGFFTCPNCGPISKEQLQKEREEFRSRLAAAEQKFLKEVS